LGAALGSNGTHRADLGPLALAHTGAPAGAGALLCLLSGYLDNAAELMEALDRSAEIPPDFSHEQLLAAGYRRWGAELLGRMRGDFALLIWDHDRGEGLLARDQLGVRSVFIHEDSGVLRFATEINHLLGLLPRRPEPDRVSVAHWIAVSNRPGPHTLFEGIRRLDPATVLTMDGQGAHERVYWAPRFVEPAPAPPAELASRTRQALELAVARRLAPESLTGVLMSGGLDSASVAALAAGQAPGRARAYSGLFPDHPAVDESQLIAELRAALGLAGASAEVRAGGMVASAVASIAAWQVPPPGWGDFWILPLLQHACTAGVPVMLDGHGGDELFDARIYLLADVLRGGHPLRSVRAAMRLPGAGDRPPRRQVLRVARDFALLGAVPPGPQLAAHRVLGKRGLPGWLRSGAAKDLLSSDDPYAWKRLDGPRWWASAAHGLTRGIEETGVFEHERHRSTTAGLTTRHPFFDLDLIELGLKHPPLESFDPHRNRPVLRAAMAGVLPDSVRLRPEKARFDTLLMDSLALSDGPLVRRLVTDPGAELRGFVDQGHLEVELLDSVEARSESPFVWMHQVWRLVTVECWLRSQNGPARDVLAGDLPSPADIRISAT
jgi:asparagine synthase (glutamine-hydrolysing)